MLTAASGEQVPYMVLEWLEGQPLEAVLESERLASAPLRLLEQAIRLLDPVAEALALAHKKGIAHRDVKPANVFVLGDPRGSDVGVKLLDFGIAKVVQDAQKAGFGKTAGHMTSFTPSYGAPEQFNRAYGATGPWTDVFALALVVVEVLTGREPLPGDTLVQLAYAASDPAVRPTPRRYGVKMPDEVHAIFVKALAVKPEDRYATAGELWSALRTAALGHPMSTLASVRSEPSVDAAELGRDGRSVGPRMRRRTWPRRAHARRRLRSQRLRPPSRPRLPIAKRPGEEPDAVHRRRGRGARDRRRRRDDQGAVGAGRCEAGEHDVDARAALRPRRRPPQRRRRRPARRG